MKVLKLIDHSTWYWHIMKLAIHWPPSSYQQIANGASWRFHLCRKPLETHSLNMTFCENSAFFLFSVWMIESKKKLSTVAELTEKLLIKQMEWTKRVRLEFLPHLKKETKDYTEESKFNFYRSICSKKINPNIIFTCRFISRINI